MIEHARCDKDNSLLRFATNGHGRVVSVCPVCDEGAKPSMPPRSVVLLPPDDAEPPGVFQVFDDRFCSRCGRVFSPRNWRQRFCGVVCASAERHAYSLARSKRERTR